MDDELNSPPNDELYAIAVIVVVWFYEPTRYWDPFTSNAIFFPLLQNKFHPLAYNLVMLHE